MTAPLRVDVREENHEAALRCRVYAELAAAFRYPSSEAAAARIADGVAEQEIIGLMEQLGVTVSPGEPGGHRAADGVDVQHFALFDSSAGAAVSLHERDYVQSSREVLWEDLFRCYTHFGLEFEDGGLREAPDALPIELEFMHYMAFLEASGPGSSRGVVLGQADFVARHLAPWVPRVHLALSERAPESIYCRLARLLADFIAADCVSSPRSC